MQVFKMFFKVLKKNMGQIIIYLVVFLAVTAMTMRLAKPIDNTDFSAEKSNITVIDRDGGALAQNFKNYLGSKDNLIDLPDDTERLQDDLFFRNIEYIVIIPNGFSQDFLSGKEVTLEKVVVPDSTTASYVTMQIDSYLNTLRMYLNNSKMTPEQAMQNTVKDLEISTPVTMKSFQASISLSQNLSYYFRYLAYVMVAMIMLGMSTILMVFNEPNLRQRNLCSPVRLRSINLQLALGSTVFSVVCWLIMVLFSFCFYGSELLSSDRILLFGLNSLILTFVCMSIGFMVGNFIKSYSAQSAVANVLALGMSFLCGVFVPQEIMSANVLNVSKFLPIYWYTKANDTIGALNEISAQNLQPVFQSMLIQAAFAVAIFSVTLFVSKQKRSNCS